MKPGKDAAITAVAARIHAVSSRIFIAGFALNPFFPKVRYEKLEHRSA